MSTQKDTTKRKSIIAKIKAIFADDSGSDGSITNPEPTISSTTSDGKAVMITKVDANATEPAVGDSVTVDGVIPAAGDIVLSDNSTLTVDATGKITAIKEADDAGTGDGTSDTGVSSGTSSGGDSGSMMMHKQNFEKIVKKLTAFNMEDQTSAEELNNLFTKFADGTPEERIANLEIVCRALMEYAFGWQLREAQAKQTTDNAISIYKNSLQPVQAMAAKHEKIIPEMFTLLEEVVELPQTTASTLSEKQKAKLEKQDKKEATFNRIADAVASLKEEAKNKH